MEYYQAVSRLISEEPEKVPPLLLCFNEDGEDEYALARLIIKASSELDFSSFDGVKQTISDGDGHYVVQFESSGSARCADVALQENDAVVYSEPDQIMIMEEEESEEQGTAERDLSHHSWGICHIGTDPYAAYAKICSDRELCVAVVDSGIHEEHPCFESRIASGKYDFVENDTEPQDGMGHGTFVSGIVVDTTLSLSNIKVLPIRVFDGNGKTTLALLCNGIRYAADQGAEVINCSFGITDGMCAENLHEAIDYATEKGSLVVAASGNSNTDVFCPASYDQAVIAVGSVDSNEIRASYSNYGESLDVCAPGDKIEGCAKICDGYGYEIGSGTSYAAPHVSACAAMIRLANPSYTPQDTMNILCESCRDLGDPGWDPYYGWGIVDLSSLLIAYRYEEDTHTLEITSAIPNVWKLFMAEYDEKGKMMEIHRISAEDPSVSVTPAVSTVKLFLLDDTCKPLCMEKIHQICDDKGQ